MILQRWPLGVLLVLIMGAVSEALGAGHAGISVIPAGDFAIRNGRDDVLYPLARDVQGPIEAALVLIAAQPRVESQPGPVFEDETPDPFAPPKVNPQVPGIIRMKIGDRELPEWTLESGRTAYFIGWDIVRGNRAFPDSNLAMSVALESEADAVRVSLIALPDVNALGGEKAGGFAGTMAQFIGQLPEGDAQAYFKGLSAEMAGDHASAKATYEGLAKSARSDIARFARRGLRMLGYQNRPHKLSGNVVEHYRWGLYAQVCGLISPAFSEFEEVRIIDSTHAQSQFRAGEMLERLGGDTLDVIHYFNRTGENTPFERPTIWSALIVIVKSRGAKELTPEEIINIKDQFILLDRVLWAATHGAFRMSVSFHQIDKEAGDGVVRHLDRVTGPPDDLIAKRGWYDAIYYVRPRIEGEDRNVFEVGWTDVGPNGAALAAIYHDSPFTSYLRCVYGMVYEAMQSIGETAGVPDPAGALACGFQPQRFGGSAIRSALRYYVSRGDLERLVAADEPVELSFVRLWQLSGPRVLNSDSDPLPADWPEGDGGAQPKRIVAPRNYVELSQHFPAEERQAVRAVSWVYSPKRQPVWIRLGYADRAALRLNGQPVMNAPSHAGGKFEGKMLVDTSFTRETLEEGWNEIELVVASRPSDKPANWGFSVSITTLDKQPVPGLASVFERPKDRIAKRWAPPAIGPYYDWGQVRDDFHRLLPQLASKDLQKITGLADLQIRKVAERDAPMIALECSSRASGAAYRNPADWSGRQAQDFQLNNVMDWRHEVFAAMRYEHDGNARDLLLVRPEAMEAATFILKEADTAAALFDGRTPSQRVYGWIDFPPLGCVFVMDARLVNDEPYPIDEEDILTPFGKFVPNGPDEFREGPPLPAPENQTR